MSRIGVSTNLFQPGTQCMYCKHWIPATSDLKGLDIVDRDIVRKRVEEAKEDETNSNSH